MAFSKVAQVERLFQDITERFNRTNCRLSAAWAELEHTREALQQLRVVYRRVLEEQELEKREKKLQDLERFF